MDSLLSALSAGRWSLTRARETARRIEGNKRQLGALVAALFGEDIEVRKRAADVARRITERATAPLEPFADELAGLLAEIPVEESRTRWHLGLVVPRVAHSHEQRMRAARLMSLLGEDESNVVRCSAVEGLALLATEENSLRDAAEEMIERSLLVGTMAMKSRARHARKRLARRSPPEGKTRPCNLS